MNKQSRYLGLVFFCFTACATPKVEAPKESVTQDSNATARVVDDRARDAGVVVLQIGRKSPHSSTLSNDAWVQIRNTTKDLRLKAESALALGSPDVAEKEARLLLRESPDHIAALEALSVALAMKRNFVGASYYAQRLEFISSENPVSANVLGISTMFFAQARPMDFDRAQKYFESAVQRDSREVAAALNLGYLHLERGNNDAANSAFVTGVDRCKSCREALMGAGVAALRSSQFKKAQDYFQKILSQEPKSAEARYRLALVAKNGFQDIPTARKYLQEILSNPKVDADRIMKQRSNSLLRSMESSSQSSDRKKPNDKSSPQKTDEGPDRELMNELSE